MKKFVCLIFILLVSGCDVSSESSFKLHYELIIDHDGYKVYRFYDAGNIRYYTNCCLVSSD